MSHYSLSTTVCHVYVRNRVGLELVQVDVERAVETKRGRDRRDNLSNETVDVSEAWENDVEMLLANVLKSLVADA